MKNIIILILFMTLSCNAQNPTPFARLKITANLKDNTATRILVQDSITKEVKWILKSSIGGATTPTLQQVTNAGATTTNDVTVSPLDGSSAVIAYANGSMQTYNVTNNNGVNVRSDLTEPSIEFKKTYPNMVTLKKSTDVVSNISVELPIASGRLALTTDIPAPVDISGKANISGQVFTGAISATNLSGTNTGDQDLSGKENTANKQNSLTTDGTGVKFPTVDAVNTGLATKQPTGTYSTDIHSNITALNLVSGTNTGDETLSTIKTKLGITTLSGSNTGDQVLTGLDYAPTSGSANYIQNQNASAQSANMWISGDVKARAGAFSSYMDVLGIVSSGNSFITNKGGLYFNGYNNYNAGIFSNTSGTGLSFQTGENITLNLAPSGAATFSSSVTAPGFFQSSDRRLKTILKRDGDVAYFTWKDGRDSKTHIGYIAQEVRRKFPDQVQKDEKGMLSVSYIEILVEKVRLLEKRIDELEKK